MVAMVSNVRDIGSKIYGEIKADAIGEKGVGAIVYILATPGGDVSLSDLTSALVTEGSSAVPPEAPSTVLRTARAAAKVAADHDFSCVSRRNIEGAKRGTQGWELVQGAYVNHSIGGGMGARVSPIVATARAGSFDGRPDIVSELRAAFHAAEDVLTNEDISSWFTAKVDGLGGIAIKGGVYYLPPESAPRFAKLVNAVQRVTGGKFEVHAAPMASTEGSLRVVLSALVHDTDTAVQEVNETITEGRGKRALEARETKCRDLLARLDRYAGLLGDKLDAIRAGVENAQAAVAVAVLAADADAANEAK
jgi:hypothetical protein